MTATYKFTLTIICLIVSFLLVQTSYSATYYWDTNNSTAGFGNAGGTWNGTTTNNATQGWTTAVLGNTTLSGTTTTASGGSGNDLTYFGTTANGLGAGTVAVTGTVNSSGLIFGSTNGAVVLNGGTIQIRGNIYTTADNTSDMQTINSNVSFLGSTVRQIGGGSSVADRLTINGNISSGSTHVIVSTENNLGTVTLNGSNSFTGNLVIQTGQLNVSRVNNIGANGPLGNGTIVFGNGGGSTPNLWYTGTSAGSTNRTISLNSSTTRIISQDARLTLAGDISPTGATPTLQLSGDGGGNFNEISGIISGNIAVQVVSHQPVGGTAEAGAWILSGNNTYTRATTISDGTLEIGSAGRLGGGSYASNILNSGTLIYSGTNNQTLSGIISGTGALTHNASSTLTLSGNNTYNGTTTINSGTLNVAHVKALGNSTAVNINGGSLLVGVDDSINGMQITLNGTVTNVATLAFNGNYNGTIGALTLQADSILDLGTESVTAIIDSIINMDRYILKVYSWTGTRLSEGGDGTDVDRLFFGRSLTAAELNNIRFYGDSFGNDFLGTGYEVGFVDGFAQVIPVPEPETWATAMLLLIAGIYMFNKKSKAVKN